MMSVCVRKMACKGKKIERRGDTERQAKTYLLSFRVYGKDKISHLKRKNAHGVVFTSDIFDQGLTNFMTLRTK